jgi:hypothetical protein
MIYQSNGPWKQVEVSILSSDKVDFKLKLLKRDKEGHFILIKEAIHQGEITVSTYLHPISSNIHKRT